ncbi:MAG: hypothetical protein Kow0020_02050 [Wenzhouxiangellaceae bacterium]
MARPWDSTLPLAATLLLLLACGDADAGPHGYAVNSRGFLPDDQMHRLWHIDLETGQATALGQTGFLDIEGLAITSDGRLLAADDESKTLVELNRNSGFGTPVGGSRNNMSVALMPMDLGMTYTCDERLLVSSDVERSLYEADPTTGRLTRIGEAGSLGAPITDLAAWGDRIFGISEGSAGGGDEPNLYLVDPETATATLIGPLGAAVHPYANAGLAFDEQGVLWAVTDRRDAGQLDLPAQILRIDIDSGQATHVADAEVVGFESLAISAPGGCDLQGGGSPIIVPAYNRTGLVILVLLLGILAMRVRPGGF